MDMPNISSSSQALASYAAQLQAVQPRNQDQGTPTRDRVDNAQPSTDRVTLSAQSARTPNGSGEAQANRASETERASNTQAVERKQLSSPEETRSAASKSVTQALEAYVQTSLI